MCCSAAFRYSWRVEGEKRTHVLEVVPLRVVGEHAEVFRVEAGTLLGGQRDVVVEGGEVREEEAVLGHLHAQQTRFGHSSERFCAIVRQFLHSLRCRFFLEGVGGEVAGTSRSSTGGFEADEGGERFELRREECTRLGGEIE